MTDLEVNRRLKKIIEDILHMSPLDFPSKYNDKKGQKTYNILHGKNGISNKMLDEILNAYPDINKVWLLTGEGEALLSDKNPIDIPKDSSIYERLIKQLEKRILDNKKIIESKDE